MLELEDNSLEMKKQLQLSLQALRIDAQAQVLELHDVDLNQFIYERTLRMNKRTELLQEFQEQNRKSSQAVSMGSVFD